MQPTASHRDPDTTETAEMTLVLGRIRNLIGNAVANDEERPRPEAESTVDSMRSMVKGVDGFTVMRRRRKVNSN